MHQSGTEETKWNPKWKAAFAALISFGAFGAIAVVTTTTLRLTNFGTYNAVQRTIYTVIVTLVSTILTAMIVDGLRGLYLGQIDNKLDGFAQNDVRTQKRVDARWQTALGISSIKDKFRNFSVESSLLLAALVTTCITAGFTATSATRVEPYSPYIPSPDPFIFARPWDKGKQPSYGILNWDLGNGSWYSVWVWAGGSPQHNAYGLMNGINIIDPQVYAYSDRGVAVRSSAIGAPVTIYDPQHASYGLQDIMEQYDWNVNAASACVPAMVKNPVKCHQGGNTTWLNGGKTVRTTSDDGKCKHQQDATDNKTYFTWMLKETCTTGKVGQAVAIFGATSGYANWLAMSMGIDLGPEYSKLPAAQQMYTVQCDIDATDNVFQYRNVTLSISRQGTATSPYNRVLSSDNSSCSPPGHPAISLSLAATAAMGPYFTTYEDGAAGWFQSLLNVASSTGDYGHAPNESIRRPPFAFPDSTNALEDVLGLMGALSVSRAVLNMSLVHTTGSAEVVFTRIGPGKLFALAFAILPLLVGVIVTSLMFTVKNNESGLKSNSLRDLVKLGENNR
jgi:hypothetical protein